MRLPKKFTWKPKKNNEPVTIHALDGIQVYTRCGGNWNEKGWEVKETFPSNSRFCSRCFYSWNYQKLRDKFQHK